MVSQNVIAFAEFGGDQVLALVLLLVATFIASGIAGFLIEKEARKVSSRQH